MEHSTTRQPNRHPAGNQWAKITNKKLPMLVEVLTGKIRYVSNKHEHESQARPRCALFGLYEAKCRNSPLEAH